MPHALLLSPDDQAVSAITGVLEEMSVTCERPLDGASAAQRINSHSFDLVLVDCENLPAAKLIFDVCRRGKSGNNPVPIAIVDGRAGLPTAFRLGAELILTKPVAKDQARSTIRTAVSRVRKEAPTNESVPPPAGERGHIQHCHDQRGCAQRGPDQRGPDRRTRAGGSCRSRFFATDKLCRARSKVRSNRGSKRRSSRRSQRCSRRFSRDALRASRHREDAFRRGRNRCHTSYSKVESAARVLFSTIFVRVIFFVRVIIFVRVNFGSRGFGKLESRAPAKTFRRSGACGTGRKGTGGIATEKLGTEQSNAGSTCSQIWRPGLYVPPARPAQETDAGRVADAHARRRRPLCRVDVSAGIPSHRPTAD